MSEQKLDLDDFVGMFFHLNKFEYNLDALTDDEDPDKI